MLPQRSGGQLGVDDQRRGVVAPRRLPAERRQRGAVRSGVTGGVGDCLEDNVQNNLEVVFD